MMIITIVHASLLYDKFKIISAKRDCAKKKKLMFTISYRSYILGIVVISFDVYLLIFIYFCVCNFIIIIYVYNFVRLLFVCFFLSCSSFSLFQYHINLISLRYCTYTMGLRRLDARCLWQRTHCDGDAYRAHYSYYIKYNIIRRRYSWWPAESRRARVSLSHGARTRARIPIVSSRNLYGISFRRTRNDFYTL